jgi:hypothetical protein
MSTTEPAAQPSPPPHFGQLVGPVQLPSLTAIEHEQVMEQLREWVAALVVRFDIDARVIPPCWEHHNGMVEALSALRDHERDCYADNAPPSAAVDWLRAFREIEARLIELASLTNCTAREHRQPTTCWATPAMPPSQPPAGEHVVPPPRA